MHPDTKSDRSTQTADASKPARASKSEISKQSQLHSFQPVIASLMQQLRRENETISRLMERQRSLRQQLLNAQQRSLLALRRATDPSQTDPDR